MATDLTKVEGQIVQINPSSRTLVIKDRQGTQNPVKYDPSCDPRAGKLQQWWFTAAIGTKDNDGILHAVDLPFFKKPDDWPTSGKPRWNGGGNNPKNERLIAKQVCMKEASVIAQNFVPAEGVTPTTVARETAEVYRILRDAMFEDEKEVATA